MTQTRTLEEIEADMQAEINGQEGDDDGTEQQSQQLPDEDGQEDETEVSEEGQEVEDGDTSPEPQTDAEKAMALGWTPYQEYIDNGGDPEMYRGAKAFLQFYENRQRDKATVQEKDSQLDELKSELSKLAGEFAEDRKKQKAAFKKELEERLKQQKEDLDVDGYAQTAEELKQLEGEMEASDAPPQKEHQVIQQFRSENSVFDRESEKFNPDANDMLETLVNQRLVKLANDGVSVTERSLQKTIQEQSERVKRAFPEAFGQEESQRRGARRRRAPATAEQEPSKGGKPSKKLDAESQKFYDALKRTNGQAAADEFKRKILEA